MWVTSMVLSSHFFILIIPCYIEMRITSARPQWKAMHITSVGPQGKAGTPQLQRSVCTNKSMVGLSDSTTEVPDRLRIIPH